MTLYVCSSQQKIHLEHHLAKELAKFYPAKTFADLKDWVSSSLVVNTIDSFQGQEAELVFVSLARSGADGLGFASDQRRANVLLSRSSQMLVIFGNAATWTRGHSSSSPLLVPFMAHYASRHQAMFLAAGHKLSSHTLGEVGEQPTEGLKQSPRTAKKKSLSDDKAAVKKAAATPQPTSRAVTRNTVSATATSEKLDPKQRAFLQKVQLHVGVVTNGILLHVLGGLIPTAERPSSASLLTCLRDLPGLSLHQLANNDWVVTLTDRHEPIMRSFTDKVIAIIEKGGGSALLSTIGTAIPVNERPTNFPSLLHCLHAVPRVKINKGSKLAMAASLDSPPASKLKLEEAKAVEPFRPTQSRSKSTAQPSEKIADTAGKTSGSATRTKKKKLPAKTKDTPQLPTAEGKSAPAAVSHPTTRPSPSSVEKTESTAQPSGNIAATAGKASGSATKKKKKKLPEKTKDAPQLPIAEGKSVSVAVSHVTTRSNPSPEKQKRQEFSALVVAHLKSNGRQAASMGSLGAAFPMEDRPLSKGRSQKLLSLLKECPEVVITGVGSSEIMVSLLTC